MFGSACKPSNLISVVLSSTIMLEDMVNGGLRHILVAFGMLERLFFSPALHIAGCGDFLVIFHS